MDRTPWFGRSPRCGRCWGDGGRGRGTRTTSSERRTVNASGAPDRPSSSSTGKVLGKRSAAGDHSQIDQYEGLTEARIESASKNADGSWRRFPVEVDGDYIGEVTELDLGIEVGALKVIA